MPSREEAVALLHEWNTNPSLRKHGLLVEAGVRGYAADDGLNPDGGSGDEIEAIKANKDNKGPQAPDVIDVVQRRQRAPLRRRVYVEGLAHALHQTDQLLCCHSVADAQTCQPVQFGKRPQRENRSILSMVTKRIRIATVLHVFEIGLVDDEQYIARDLAKKAFPFVAPVDCPRRIIGIGEKDDSSLRRDRIGYRRQIVGKVAKRHCRALAADGLDDELIDYERLPSHHGFVTRAHERSDRELDDFI